MRIWILCKDDEIRVFYPFCYLPFKGDMSSLYATHRTELRKLTEQND